MAIGTFDTFQSAIYLTQWIAVLLILAIDVNWLYKLIKFKKWRLTKRANAAEAILWVANVITTAMLISTGFDNGWEWFILIPAISGVLACGFSFLIVEEK